MMIADDRRFRAVLALALTLGALALLYVQGVQTAASVKRRIGYDLITAPDGVHVEDVSPGEPADRAGLRRGDRVVTIDGTPIRDLLSYATASGRFQAGKPAVFRLVRGGRTVDLTLRPGMAFPLFTFLFNALPALGRAALLPGGTHLRPALVRDLSRRRAGRPFPAKDQRPGGPLAERDRPAVLGAGGLGAVGQPGATSPRAPRPSPGGAGAVGDLRLVPLHAVQLDLEPHRSPGRGLGRAAADAGAALLPGGSFRRALPLSPLRHRAGGPPRPHLHRHLDVEEAIAQHRGEQSHREAEQ